MTARQIAPLRRVVARTHDGLGEVADRLAALRAKHPRSRQVRELREIEAAIRAMRIETAMGRTND